MDNENWKLWCRLCASYDTSNIDLNIFPDSNFSNALNTFFSINLSESNQLGCMICINCHATVERIIEFGQKVSRVQLMFLKFLHSDKNLNLNQLKVEFEIDDVSYQKPSNQSPVVDTFYEPGIQLTQDDSKSEVDLFETSNIKTEDSDRENDPASNEEKDINKLAEQPNNTSKSVQCSECHKTFRNLNSMKRHLRKQHGLSTRVTRPKSQLVCEECGKVCINRARLLEHQLVHVEDRPFACRQCGKSFKNKLRLKYHEDTHSTTSYICTICGIRLNSKPTLNMHMVVHSDQKRFKCDYCGNEYKRAKALKAHLILHTGLKPYSCDFCDRTFANGSNCRSHKKKAHPVELAAMEAAGKTSSYTKVPELKELKAALEIPNKLTI